MEKDEACVRTCECVRARMRGDRIVTASEIWCIFAFKERLCDKRQQKIKEEEGSSCMKDVHSAALCCVVVRCDVH